MRRSAAEYRVERVRVHTSGRELLIDPVSQVALVSEPDVPSPLDLRDPRDARDWERTAQDRPGRAEIFRAFARELA